MANETEPQGNAATQEEEFEKFREGRETEAAIYKAESPGWNWQQGGTTDEATEQPETAAEPPESEAEAKLVLPDHPVVKHEIARKTQENLLRKMELEDVEARLIEKGRGNIFDPNISFSEFVRRRDFGIKAGTSPEEVRDSLSNLRRTARDSARQEVTDMYGQLRQPAVEPSPEPQAFNEKTFWETHMQKRSELGEQIGAYLDSDPALADVASRLEAPPRVQMAMIESKAPFALFRYMIEHPQETEEFNAQIARGELSDEDIINTIAFAAEKLAPYEEEWSPKPKSLRLSDDLPYSEFARRRTETTRRANAFKDAVRKRRWGRNR